MRRFLPIVIRFEAETFDHLVSYYRLKNNDLDGLCWVHNKSQIQITHNK